MKLSWYDRILNFVAFLLLGALAAACFYLLTDAGRLMAAGLIAIIPSAGVNTIILIGAGVIVAVLAVYYLVMTFAVRGKGRVAAPRSVLVRHGEIGAVEITLSAIDTLVQKTVRKQNGVRDCSTVVAVNANSELELRVALSILPDTTVPELSEKLQTEVKEYVEAYGGVRVASVAVMVETTGMPQPSKVQ